MKHLKRYKIQMYVDDELSSSENVRVESHLSQCDQCSLLKQQIQGQADQLKAAFGEDDLEHVLIPELDLRENPEGNNKKNYIRVPVPAFAAMLIVIVFLGALSIFQFYSNDKPNEASRSRSNINYVKMQIDDFEEVKSIDLDISNYSIIKNPKIRIIKGEGDKNETI